MDASTDAFRQAYGEDGVRPHWVVTSPPYKNALRISKQAMDKTRAGVAFKLRIHFLEPTRACGD